MELSFGLEEIPEAARQFWQMWPGRKVFAFHGEMGAGKTTFIHALCRELGVQVPMSSPTFSLINVYPYSADGQAAAIFHLDLYRLKGLDEAIRAGVEDCLFQGSICLIEWPELIEPVLPQDSLHVYFSGRGEEKRKLVAD